MSTYAERQAYRDSHPGAIVDNSSSSDGGFHSDTANGVASGTPSSSGGGGNSGGGGGGGGPAPAPQQDASAQLGQIQQSILNAVQTGNKAAADQAAAQFMKTFGLDTQKFEESVRQYNQNYGLAQSGVSGLMPDGTPTLAAQTAQNKTGVDMLTLAASLHADPFRQLQVMYGANQMPGINRAVQGLTGQYGLPGAFTAPAGGTSATLGGLSQSYYNAGQGLTPQQQAANTGLTNANQIIAREYNAAPQNVQDFATSALSMNNGLDQAANNKLIQNNLPKFNAPSFGLATV